MAEKTTESEDRRDDREEAAYWKEQIALVEQHYADFQRCGEKICERYRDERNKALEEGARRLNTLWSNTEILTPAIYSQVPRPTIERRFLDRDPVGRMSATILERTTVFELEENGFHPAITRAVKDYLLPGRGTVWARYEPKFGKGVSLKPSAAGEVTDEAGNRILSGDVDETGEKLEETDSEIVTESAPVDYIHWKDFLIFPAHARTWEEVTAAGKRVYKSRDECIERFGEEIGKAIQPDTELEQEARKINPNLSITFDRHSRHRVIYEIWNKEDRTVYWVSTGYDYLCDKQEDPLELEHFFPCPPPLFATATNDTLVPVPFYHEYQDQALQIDELSQRIHMLGKCIKAAGVYDASNLALRRLLEESVENELIPVSDWRRLADANGIEGSISLLPIRDFVEALQVLVELRAKIMEDLDRVTGIADILRGTSDARETLGGQRLKQNTANTRLDKLRNDVAIFVRDTIRIVAEIVAKHFKKETLIKASGILYEEEIDPGDYQGLLEQMQPDTLPPPSSSQGQGQTQPAALPPPQGQQPPPPSQGALVPHPAFPGAQSAPGAPQAGAPSSPASPVPTGQPGAPTAPGIPPVPAGPPPAVIKVQRIEKAVALLKDDIPRGYRITIEANSTIAGEVEQERGDAIQFVGAVTKFLETAQMIGAQNPVAVPLLGKMLQFAVRKFRTGRDLESAIDDFVDKAEQAAKQPHPQQPNPEMIKAQAEVQKMQLQAQLEAQNDQREQQREEIAAQRDAQMQQLEFERQKQIKELDYMFKQRELEMKERFEMARMQREEHFETQRMTREQQHMAMESQIKQQQMARDAEFGEASHNQRMEQMKQQAAQKKQATNGKEAA
jgi:hypothetical protein